MPELQGVDAGEEWRHPAVGQGAGGRRKKRAVSEMSLLSKSQAQSSREQPTTHAPVIFPRRRQTWEAVNLPGTGLHLRCNSVFAQRGSCLIFFTGNQKGEVSASPHPAVTAVSHHGVAPCVPPWASSRPPRSGQRGARAPTHAPAPALVPPKPACSPAQRYMVAPTPVPHRNTHGSICTQKQGAISGAHVQRHMRSFPGDSPV